MVSNEKDDVIDLRFITAIYQKLRNNGTVFCFVGQATLHIFQKAFLDCGFKWRNTIIWHYENTISRESSRFVIQYDPILFFSKSNEYTFNIDDVRVPYKSTERLKYPVSKNGKSWYPHPKGARRGDVWQFPAITSPSYTKEKTDHKWQKPIEVCELIIKSVTNENDTVLDPFLGSGTTLLACRRTNRNGIGFEIEPKYESIIRKRIMADYPSIENWKSLFKPIKLRQTSIKEWLK